MSSTKCMVRPARGACCLAVHCIGASLARPRPFARRRGNHPWLSCRIRHPVRRACRSPGVPDADHPGRSRGSVADPAREQCSRWVVRFGLGSRAGFLLASLGGAIIRRRYHHWRRSILCRTLIAIQSIQSATIFAALATVIGAAAPASAQQGRPPPAPQVHIPPTSTLPDDASALAEKLQNPIGDLISVPFQSNTNFDVGPNKGAQEILNIQPVIPIHLNEDWNLITRTILPLVWNPSFQPAQSVPFGLAPTSFTAFLSPSKPVNGWIWGAGPIVQLPTITSKTLGSNVWGAGPAAVVVRMDSPWVYGLLVNNVFSFGGTTGRGGTSYNVLTINPFVNYNFGGGWFVGTVPVVTANWDTGGEKWTLPVGAQFGRLIKLGGKLPVNLLVGAYYNALRPQFGATWQLRTQIAIIF